MHARVVTNQIQAGKVDQWLALVRESVVPALKELWGFKGFVAMTDAKAGKTIGYSLWETEADLEASEASGNYQRRLPNSGAFSRRRPCVRRTKLRSSPRTCASYTPCSA
jgi:quinol monooxygenase YgiN